MNSLPEVAMHDLVCVVQALLLLAGFAKLICDISCIFSHMPNIFSVRPGCHSAYVILHDFIFELNTLFSLRSLAWCIWVFIVFRSDLHLILDWMIAIVCCFDLLSVLKILREN